MRTYILFVFILQSLNVAMAINYADGCEGPDVNILLRKKHGIVHSPYYPSIPGNQVRDCITIIDIEEGREYIELRIAEVNLHGMELIVYKRTNVIEGNFTEESQWTIYKRWSGDSAHSLGDYTDPNTNDHSVDTHHNYKNAIVLQEDVKIEWKKVNTATYSWRRGFMLYFRVVPPESLIKFQHKDDLLVFAPLTEYYPVEDISGNDVEITRGSQISIGMGGTDFSQGPLFRQHRRNHWTDWPTHRHQPEDYDDIFKWFSKSSACVNGNGDSMPNADVDIGTSSTTQKEKMKIPASTSVTYSMWYRWTAQTGRVAKIFSYEVGTGAGDTWAETNSGGYGTLRFKINGAIATTPAVFREYRWYYITMVYDQLALKCRAYLDAILIHEAACNAGSQTATSGIRLQEQYGHDNQRGYYSAISCFVVYKRALDEIEIDRLQKQCEQAQQQWLVISDEKEEETFSCNFDDGSLCGWKHRSYDYASLTLSMDNTRRSPYKWDLTGPKQGKSGGLSHDRDFYLYYSHINNRPDHTYIYSPFVQPGRKCISFWAFSGSYNWDVYIKMGLIDGIRPGQDYDIYQIALWDKNPAWYTRSWTMVSQTIFIDKPSRFFIRMYCPQTSGPYYGDGGIDDIQISEGFCGDERTPCPDGWYEYKHNCYYIMPMRMGDTHRQNYEYYCRYKHNAEPIWFDTDDEIKWFTQATAMRRKEYDDFSMAIYGGHWPTLLGYVSEADITIDGQTGLHWTKTYFGRVAWRVSSWTGNTHHYLPAQFYGTANGYNGTNGCTPVFGGETTYTILDFYWSTGQTCKRLDTPQMRWDTTNQGLAVCKMNKLEASYKTFNCSFDQRHMCGWTQGFNTVARGIHVHHSRQPLEANFGAYRHADMHSFVGPFMFKPTDQRRTPFGEATGGIYRGGWAAFDGRFAFDNYHYNIMSPKVQMCRHQACCFSYKYIMGQGNYDRGHGVYLLKERGVGHHEYDGYSYEWSNNQLYRFPNENWNNDFFDWRHASFDIYEPMAFNIYLRFWAGHYDRNHNGVDDVKITPGKCKYMYHADTGSTGGKRSEADADYKNAEFYPNMVDANFKQQSWRWWRTDGGVDRRTSPHTSGYYRQQVNGPSKDYDGPERYGYFATFNTEQGPHKTRQLWHESFPPGQKCFKFRYNMQGPDIGELKVYKGSEVVWAKWFNTEQGQAWWEGRIPYVAEHPFQVTFSASGGIRKDTNYQYDDIFVDSITLENGTAPCLNYFDCDFDGPDHEWMTGCGWRQNDTDETDFLRGRGESAKTNDYTGPVSDHTSGTGFYALFDATGLKPGASAKMLSPPIAQGRSCFSFWYSMYGRNMGSLRVYYVPKQNPQNASLNHEFPPYREIELFRRTGSQGNRWFKAQIQLDFDYSQELIIDAMRGNGIYSDIAVDDIQLFKGDCAVHDSWDCSFDDATTCLWTQTANGIDYADFKVTDGLDTDEFFGGVAYGPDAFPLCSTSYYVTMSFADTVPKAADWCRLYCSNNGTCPGYVWDDTANARRCLIYNYKQTCPHMDGHATDNFYADDHYNYWKIRKAPRGDWNGVYGGGKYLLFDANHRPRRNAKITSPSVKGGAYCFSFAYIFTGKKTGQIRVTMNDGSESILKLMKDHFEHWDDEWKRQAISIDTEGADFTVTIEAIKGNSMDSHVALDDLKFETGSCPGQATKQISKTKVKKLLPAENLVADKRLYGHAFKVILESSLKACQDKCQSTPTCKSINVNSIFCELNDATRYDDPYNFVDGCQTVSEDKYDGHESTTENNYPCQAWALDNPHNHADVSAVDGSAEKSKSYCRNPDSSATGVWCYTMNPLVVKERCNVPICDGTTFYWQKTTNVENKRAKIDSRCPLVPDHGVLTNDCRKLSFNTQACVIEPCRSQASEGGKMVCNATVAAPRSCIVSRDCQAAWDEFGREKEGAQLIMPFNSDTAFEVYCWRDSGNRVLNSFIRRFDGSLRTWNRKYAQHEEGLGSADREHQISLIDAWRLRTSTCGGTVGECGHTEYDVWGHSTRHDGSLYSAKLDYMSDNPKYHDIIGTKDRSSPLKPLNTKQCAIDFGSSGIFKCDASHKRNYFGLRMPGVTRKGVMKLYTSEEAGALAVSLGFTRV